MKSFVVIAAFLALANAGRDWSSIERLDIVASSKHQLPRIIEPGTRIVGGEEASPHSLPYQAALFVDIGGRTAFCGGSLISPNYVLTAAHCVQPAKSIEVVLGAHKIREEEPTQVRLVSTDFKQHEQWSMLTLKNDIALIRLPQPVELNENIQLAKLPSKSDVGKSFEEAPAKVSGWGKDTDQATAVSPVLRKVDVPIFNQFLCKLAYFGVIQDTHICTNSKGGKSTCSGDSGGPLVLQEDGTQVGIVSFGISFGCELGWPAAYTRVTSYLDWIEKNTDVKIGA